MELSSKLVSVAQKTRNSVFKTLCRLNNLPFELSPARRLQKSALTKKWQRCVIYGVNIRVMR